MSGQRHRISMAQSIAMQAPLKGQQHDLEEAIEHAKKQEVERRRFLAASAGAQAAHAGKAKDGPLADQVTVPFGKHRKEQNQSRRERMLEAFALGAEKRAPRKNAKQENIGPTPERLAKTIDDDGEQAYTVGKAVKSHTITSPVEKYGPRWPVEIETAAKQLCQLFLAAASERPTTSNYNGAGGSSFGPRDGGVPDHVREARATVDLIKTRFPSCIADIEAFVTQVACHMDGSAIKFEDTGTPISPWASPDARKGVGYGMFYRSLTVLEWFLAERSGGAMYRPEAAASLEKAIRAGAAVIREREEKARERSRRSRQITGGA